MTAVEQIETPTAEQAGQAPGAIPDLSVMGVVPGAVAAVWPHISPMVEAARSAVPDLVADREWPEDILEKAEGGLYQVWLIYQGPDLVAVAISSIEQYIRAKVCVVQYLAGQSVDTWLGAWIDEIRDWAVQIGCTQIECRGRSGWGRKLASFGAETAGSAYVMEIG